MPTGPTVSVRLHEPSVEVELSPGEGRRRVSVSPLVLIAGSNSPATVQLSGSAAAEDLLVGSDRATLTLRTAPGATPAVEATTVDGSLAIQAGDGRVVWTPTGAQAAALAPGRYLAEVWVRFGDDESWRPSETFWVEVRSAIGGTA